MHKQTSKGTKTTVRSKTRNALKWICIKFLTEYIYINIIIKKSQVEKMMYTKCSKAKNYTTFIKFVIFYFHIKSELFMV